MHGDVVGDADPLTYRRDSVGGTHDRHVTMKTTPLTVSWMFESCVGHGFRLRGRLLAHSTLHPVIPMINVQSAPAAVVNTVGPFERPCETEFGRDSTDCAQISPLLDLLAEDNRLNVYAGEIEVRPPAAPTTEPDNTRARPSTH